MRGTRARASARRSSMQVMTVMRGLAGESPAIVTDRRAGAPRSGRLGHHHPVDGVDHAVARLDLLPGDARAVHREARIVRGDPERLTLDAAGLAGRQVLHGAREDVRVDE